MDINANLDGHANSTGVRHDRINSRVNLHEPKNQSCLSPDDPFNLIDFTDAPPISGNPKKIDEITPGFQSSGLSAIIANDLDALKITGSADHVGGNRSHQQPMAKPSIEPGRSKHTKGRLNRRSNTKVGLSTKNRGQQNYRPSTPESIASEMDPYTQWYQMMQQYYKQYYPNYDTSSLGRKSCDQVERMRQTAAAPAPVPFQPAWPMTVDFSKPPDPSSPEYAAFYYQYYYGAAAAAAANMWPVAAEQERGRRTPKIFNEPHIRATLAPGLIVQILPNRPQDGEPGRVELLDLGQLATDVVAEATSRLAELCNTNASRTRYLDTDLPVSGRAFSLSRESSDAHSYSNQDSDAGHGEDEEEIKECTTLISAWDRTDHSLYPGPLARGTTIKSDVLAFLRGKLEDIQDRMPVDWDSAGLLLAYLELLVKNNGVVHTGDVVNLLMEDQSSHIYNYTVTGATSVLPSGSQQRIHTVNKHGHQRTPSDLFFSRHTGLPSEPSSGHESPSTGLRHSASSGYFKHLDQRSSAGSSTGGMSISRRLRKVATAAAGMVSGEERDVVVINRFRELLMHGQPGKALEHACQQQLWGHAFALSQRMGPTMLGKVMEKFLVRAINPSDPLLTMYQLMAGEMPQSVDQLAYTTGADNGDWRPHLAMLLSSPDERIELAREAIERMAESLLARRLLYAAHLCFLLVHSLVPVGSIAPNQQQLPPQILLLGLPRTSADNTRVETTVASLFHLFSVGVLSADGEEVSLEASTEAFQLTEIYEYSRALAIRENSYYLPQLLPYKFAYCQRLIDAGLILSSFRYLEVLAIGLYDSFSAVCSGLSPLQLPDYFIMVSHCLRFAERLQCHPEVDNFSSAMDHSFGRSGGRFEYTCPSAKDPSMSQIPWLIKLREVYYRLCGELGFASDQQPFLDVPMETVADMCDCGVEPTPSEHPPSSTELNKHQNRVSSPSTAHRLEPTSSGSTLDPKHCSRDQQHCEQLHTKSHPFRQPPVDGRNRETTSPPVAIAPYALLNGTYSNAATTTMAAAFIPQAQYCEADTYLSPTGGGGDQQQSPVDSQTPVAKSPVAPLVQHKNQPAFFNPYSNGVPETMPQQCDSQAPSTPYDYFSHLSAAQQQQHLRSRTVSVNSQDSGADGIARKAMHQPQSHWGPEFLDTMYSPETHSNSPTVNNLPCSAIIDPSSQHSLNRRFSASSSVEGDDEGEGAITPRPSMARRIMFAPAQVRSRNPSSTSTIGESRFEMDGTNHRPLYAQPSASIEESPERAGSADEQKKADESDTVDDASTATAQAKVPPRGGWFPSIFNRLKRTGGNEIHLPDDSNPALFWDETRNQWVDPSNTDHQEALPPPPLMGLPLLGSSVSGSGPPQMSGVSGLNTRTSSGRPRYVNVLANHSSGSTAQKSGVSLQPPLPPMLSSG